MSDRLEVRITGFGGQGVVLSAYIIGRACIQAGKHATMIQSFGPEARGASCSATLVISPHEVLYPYIQRPEILVAMSSDGYEKFREEMREGGTLIYESDLVNVTRNGAPASSPAGAGASRAPARVAARDAATPAAETAALPTLNSFGIPSTRIAESLQKPLVQNIVMLGFVAAVTNLVPIDAMREAVRVSVPSGTEEINLRAFDAGVAHFAELEVPV